MTWGFAYLAVFVVGLVLAGASGLVRELPFLGVHRHLVVPRVEQHSSLFDTAARRVAVVALGVGVVGFVLQEWSRLSEEATLVAAALSGLALAIIAVVAVRRPCAVAMRTDGATVVREILPDRFGQVRIASEGHETILAARSIDDAPIPEGADVEIVDCTRSVVVVRRLRPAPSQP